MKVLGLSAFYHDAAACLVVDGEIIAAAQEERFTRKKHDLGFPAQAITYCLEEAQVDPEELDYVVFYDKPFLKFERLLETYLAFAPRGLQSFVASMPLWVKDKLFQKKILIDALHALWGPDPAWGERLRFCEHHLSHAASAFFPSPFEEAAVLTMDGVGEWATSSLAVGQGNRLSLKKEIRFPHSLGLLYSAFTYYTGFKVNAGEYKLMGLAPYGEPRYVPLIKEHLIDIKDDGSFALDLRYFGFCSSLTMTNGRFHRLFGGPPRHPETELSQKEMDIAASIQAVTEEVVLKLSHGIRKTTGQRQLCLAGGVALNCVANGKLVREGIFEQVWIQPAAGDAGGAIGAALAVHHLMLDQPRRVGPGDSMKGAYLGPAYSQAEIERRLAAAGAHFVTVSDEDLINYTARALAAGQAVGWHQGRMEFGPRALGGRSILADPRSPQMQKQLNLKVKFRESFRPFAPSVLREDVADWFQLETESPYMLLVADLAASRRLPVSAEQQAICGIDKLNVPRSTIPAVTHVDYSARVQTVDGRFNPRFHGLLARFKELTGCPVLVNTSFNVRGEPIVCTPEDSFRCLMGTDIDLLAIGNCLLYKDKQPQHLLRDYRHVHEPD